MDKSKRKLISGSWLTKHAHCDTHNDTSSYFDSFESCYPLLADSALLLIDEAKAKGIDTNGKSNELIASELFRLGFVYPSQQ